MNKIAVIHVDDESHLIEAIPDQVRLSIFMNHPDYQTSELKVNDANEKEIIALFDLTSPTGKQFTIEYRIVAELPQDGWERVYIAIFDCLRINDDEYLEKFDTSRIIEAINKIGKDKVFVFTGYPEQAEDLRRHVEEENFIVKPANSLWIAERIVAKILVRID